MSIAARTRDRALDLLRGYFLVVIMIDHLRFARNPFYLISGKQSLWVTAAEGFVLISGFLVGRLRGDQARREGPRAAALHILKRAGTLALWSALLTIGFRLISEASGYWPAVPNADVHGSLLRDLWNAIDLRYTYGDHNLLAAYALWMMVAPLAILAMLRGYTAVVLAVSSILWAAALRYDIHWSNAVQDDVSWQLLFVFGMIAGFHHGELARRWALVSPRVRKLLAIAGGVLSVAIIAGSIVRWGLPTYFEAIVFHHDRLGPGRVACALVLVTSLYALVRHFEAKLLPTIGKLLVPLGESSLYVYIAQSMLTFVLVNRALANLWLAALVTICMVTLVFLLVRNKFLFRIVPR